MSVRSSAICSNPLPPGLADISRGWPSGVTPFKLTGSGDDAQKNAIRAAMTDWETQTGIVDFVEDPNNPAAWVINLDTGCTAGSMQPGCQLRHETGHLLGLAHEQQRVDAARFITLVQYDDVCDDSSEGTRYVDTIWSGTNFGPYNENSVMHYGPALGNDSTYDFTRRDGTVNNLGSLASSSPVTPARCRSCARASSTGIASAAGGHRWARAARDPARRRRHHAAGQGDGGRAHAAR